MRHGAIFAAEATAQNLSQSSRNIFCAFSMNSRLVLIDGVATIFIELPSVLLCLWAFRSMCF